MTNGTGDCTEPTMNRGYFTVSPPSTPHTTSLFWGPQSCCCGDVAGDGPLDLLLAYILIKKAANPQLVKAKKTVSPNGACRAIEVAWEFGAGAPSPQTNLDIPEILLYYLAVMAAA